MDERLCLTVELADHGTAPDDVTAYGLAKDSDYALCTADLCENPVIRFFITIHSQVVKKVFKREGNI